MSTFRAFAIFGLCVLELCQTCSAFQPGLLRKGRDSHSLKKQCFHPLALSKNDSDGKMEEFANPFFSAISNYSTLAFAAIALIFSPLPSSPASVAWADEAGVSATTQSTVFQSSPKQESVAVVEEVWNLINKYFIDRTFNGQVSTFGCGVCQIPVVFAN